MKNIFARFALTFPIVWFLTQSSLADYLDQMPDTEACRVMSEDVDPNMDSEQNIRNMKEMYAETTNEGRTGKTCQTFRSRRTELQSSRALNLGGISKYSLERVFAWGRLCLLDWCDMEPGSGTTTTVPNNTPPASNNNGAVTPNTPVQKPKKSDSQDQGSYTFQLCNMTGIPTIHVALMWFDKPTDTQLTLHGWFDISNGVCRSWTNSLGKYARHEIYYHAKGGKYVWWTANRADTNVCVTKDLSRMDRRQSSGYTCSQNEKVVGFRKVIVKKGLTMEPIKIKY